MIEVRATASAGRGVFATAPIQNGTQLVRALPFAIAPSDSCTLTHCCVCLQRVANASKCPRCESAVLCARCAGSASSSKIHDDECAALKLLAAAPADQKPKITRSLRLLIRCLCARWRERIGQPYIGEDGESWWGDGDFAADEMEDIDALVGPPDNDDVESDDSGNGAIDDYEGEDVRSGALSADLFEMAKQARFYASSETRLGHGACAELMGRLCCNTLTIYGEARNGEATREVGVALSAGVAMFNHNCSPNADWSLDSSGCLVVHTTRSVRTGEELCLSYVDIKWPRERRRAFLRKHFFFECTCEVCVPPRADAAPAAAGRADEVARKRRRT